MVDPNPFLHAHPRGRNRRAEENAASRTRAVPGNARLGRYAFRDRDATGSGQATCSQDARELPVRVAMAGGGQSEEHPHHQEPQRHARLALPLLPQREK
jgi:hypothetical protein